MDGWCRIPPPESGIGNSNDLEAQLDAANTANNAVGCDDV